jgi:hypothetical protein
MTLAFTGALNPVLVLGIAAVVGLVRPSDIGMRAAVVGKTMPASQLRGGRTLGDPVAPSGRRHF